MTDNEYKRAKQQLEQYEKFFANATAVLTEQGLTDFNIAEVLAPEKRLYEWLKHKIEQFEQDI